MKLTSQSVRPGWRRAVDKAARGDDTELVALFPPNEPEAAILTAMLKRRGRWAAKRPYDRLLHETVLRVRAVQQAMEITEGRCYGRKHDGSPGQRERAIDFVIEYLRSYGVPVDEAFKEQVRTALSRGRK